MIRCWGGNVYEDHRFFDLCDEKGILVWQDFAFACCRYPQTDDFLAQVRAEVEAVAEKLRNHPRWPSGAATTRSTWPTSADGLSPEHNRLTREVLPQVAAPLRPLPGLPAQLALRARRPSDARAGRPGAHARTAPVGPARLLQKPLLHRSTRAHFIGEIGYHGCPNVSSIRRFISPEHALALAGQSTSGRCHAVYHWQHRAIDRDRIKLMANQVRELFGDVPDDLETFALASQITQAEAKKFFIESTRLRKWRTSGMLWWNVHRRLAAVLRRHRGLLLSARSWPTTTSGACSSRVCVMIGEPGPDKYLPVVVCNDTRRPVHVRYRVSGCNERRDRPGRDAATSRPIRTGRWAAYAPMPATSGCT